MVTLDKQTVRWQDLGLLDYGSAWEFQESLMQQTIRAKMQLADHAVQLTEPDEGQAGGHFLLIVEHPPVYTLGKSGKHGNILIAKHEMAQKGIEFFNTNRGGDITFHGPGQIVCYPIFDLEKFSTDIGLYLRMLEEVVIRTLASYQVPGLRSAGETGVWIEPGQMGKERKICAIGVRCSRWVTMHGFALNVNTSLSYFDDIIPCGIAGKRVTSLAQELGVFQDMEKVKAEVRRNMEEVFQVRLQEARLR